MARWLRNLERREGLAYAALMTHCDGCECCEHVRESGELLDRGSLCRRGRALAAAWDATEAAIADVLLAPA